MSKEIKTIGIMTSGGDSSGMNAAIRAAVRNALDKGIKVKGIHRGYQGLIDNDMEDMDYESVSGIIQRGGTILYAGRCKEYMTDEGQEKAAKVCRNNNIDGVVVIGGDGSFRGAQKLARKGINTIGVPGTIDLDIACTDYTIGFDTAINTVLEAVDRIRDNATSHGRCAIVEVMGRHAGYIALWSGIAAGAEDILIPEKDDFSYDKIIKRVIKGMENGQKCHIIVNAEGVGHSYEMAEKIQKETGVETRVTVLGYIQRGGNPTCKDRMYASVMGAYAVDLLAAGKTNRVVAHSRGEFIDIDIDEALAMTKTVDDYIYKVGKM